jgi:septum formation protein
MDERIVLASASPRRRELLQQIGLEFDVVSADIDESILPGESPQEHVIRLSSSKAAAIAAREDISGRWVIGSDTIVLLDDQILGKPSDEEDAKRMLRTLSGREHQVLSGYALIDRKLGRQHSEAVATRVRFRDLTDTEIERYIATGEPADKAGSYAIQGLGVCFVASIEGSYSNVVGLPLCRLTLTLKEFGIPLPI